MKTFIAITILILIMGGMWIRGLAADRMVETHETCGELGAHYIAKECK